MMYLHQKLGYRTQFITTMEQLKDISIERYPIFVWDTETTGLNFVSDVPFLFVFGFNKNIYGFDMNNPEIDEMIEYVYKLMKVQSRCFAHNAKYDYHMMTNAGYKMNHINVSDSQVVYRLTSYADDEDRSKSLETIGIKYVDESSKFAGKVIKTKINEINRKRKSEVQKKFKEVYGVRSKFTQAWDEYGKRVPYLTYDEGLQEKFRFFDENYTPANYKDVYIEHPNLMINYAYDDCVILLDWLSKALPVLETTDPQGLTMEREDNLIPAVAEMERVGLKIDIEYILEARERVLAYRDKQYEKLRVLLGKSLSVGQHEKLIAEFRSQFGIVLTNADKKSLKAVKSPQKAVDTAKTIIELRTVDKWLSTYIDGMLSRSYEGRIYTSIDSAGAVSGRVSSNMQQQPKEPFISEDGEELFHPRRPFIPDEDYKMWFFDYSQQELRVQAYYTLKVSEGDPKLLRAYMPFQCESFITGEVFDYTDSEVLSRWDSGEWVHQEDGEPWKPVEVHDETTFKAFPHLNGDKNHPDFKHLRRLGKMCNFLKNYQGGLGAIMEQLEVDEDTAKTLDRAYYEAFPIIKNYQKWVTEQFNKFGFVENLYGRRYYMQNSKWFYKGANYLVQGSCADMVKEVELKIAKALDGTRSGLILPVHDEVILRIHKDEEYLVPIVKAIMEDVPQVPWVPMVSDVEYTETNWADKEGWHES